MMFADKEYNGKFQDEYKDIDKAEPLKPMTAEEAVEKLAEISQSALQPLVEAIANFVTVAVDVISTILPTIIQINNTMLDMYPNKRVVHLAKHGKPRVRKKNMKRIMKYYEELVKYEQQTSRK